MWPVPACHPANPQEVGAYRLGKVIFFFFWCGSKFSYCPRVLSVLIQQRSTNFSSSGAPLILRQKDLWHILRPFHACPTSVAAVFLVGKIGEEPQGLIKKAVCSRAFQILAQFFSFVNVFFLFYGYGCFATHIPV